MIAKQLSLYYYSPPSRGSYSKSTNFISSGYRNVDRVVASPKPEPLRFGEDEQKITLRVRLRRGLKKTRKVFFPTLFGYAIGIALLLLISPVFHMICLLAIIPLLCIPFVKGMMNLNPNKKY